MWINILNWTLLNSSTSLNNCDINTKKSLIRNLWEQNIEYKNSVIIQYTIAENIPFVIQYHKSYNTININKSSTLCVMYNNQESSVYRLQALNRVNNNRALFGVRSPIEIQSTPRSGLGKSLTLTGYISGLPQFTWSWSVYVWFKI